VKKWNKQMEGRKQGREKDGKIGKEAGILR
jgi:hypothetical protein